MKKILFAGGGTGGHVYMAVAVAQELVRRDSSIDVLFVGTESGLESRIVPPLGFTLKTIEIGGLKNVGLRKTIQTVFQIPVSLWQSLKIVKSFKPDVTVGVGGYASGPAILAAWLKRIPAVIIEPNVLPGLTNRLLSPLVQGAMVAFPETAEWFGEKARITGIPIRDEFHSIQHQLAKNGPLRVLIFGGSRGSHPINLLLVEAAPFLVDMNISIVHQTGPNDHAAVREAYQRSGVSAKVLKYIDDMPREFSQTDFVVSRSGASTVAEITAAGMPALLIPFPQAADDHQKKNAEALANRGAAILVEQKEIDGKSLAFRLRQLSDERLELEKMSEVSRSLARPESTNDIIDLIKEIAA